MEQDNAVFEMMYESAMKEVVRLDFNGHRFASCRNLDKISGIDKQTNCKNSKNQKIIEGGKNEIC
jgi:hypothetical protein